MLANSWKFVKIPANSCKFTQIREYSPKFVKILVNSCKFTQIRVNSRKFPHLSQFHANCCNLIWKFLAPRPQATCHTQKNHIKMCISKRHFLWTLKSWNDPHSKSYKLGKKRAMCLEVYWDRFAKSVSLLIFCAWLLHLSCWIETLLNGIFRYLWSVLQKM